MTLSTLKLVSTTMEVNLIEASAGTPGFYLIEWEPAIPQAKGGGTFVDSPLADNKTLIDRRFDNTIDTFRLAIVGTTQANVISRLNNLIFVLEEAVSFFTNDFQNWSANKPAVYLECQFEHESNPRYSLVRNYSIEKLPNMQHNTPFSGGAIIEQGTYASALLEVVLIIEHGYWLSNPPGQSDTLSISNNYTFNSKVYGHTGTVISGVQLTNHSKQANLTHIYHFDASSSAWSSNLVTAALPHNLLPNTPAANDIVYFGIATGTATSVFGSLVFDLDGNYGNNITGGIWEYWNGSTWDAIACLDHSRLGQDVSATYFDASGLCSVHFFPHAMGAVDWATNTINGVAARWVRFRVTSVGASPLPPRQQNRAVYTVSKPYVTISNSSVGGNLPALLQLGILTESAALIYPGIETTKFIGGLRSTWRGNEFDAFINLSSVQIPTNVTVTPLSPGTIVADLTAPTSRALGASLASMTEEVMTPLANITISGTLAKQYNGRFRVFLRCKPATTDVYWRVDFTLSGSYLDSENMIASTKTVTKSTTDSLPLAIDLGSVNLRTTAYGHDTDSLQIIIYAQRPTGGTGTLRVYDIVLIPTDEWSFIATGVNIEPSATLGVAFNPYLEINNTLETDVMCMSFYYDGDIRNTWQLASPIFPNLHQSNEQRLWLLAMHGILPNEATGADGVSFPYINAIPLFGKNARYLAPKES